MANCLFSLHLAPYSYTKCRLFQNQRYAKLHSNKTSLMRLLTKHLFLDFLCALLTTLKAAPRRGALQGRRYVGPTAAAGWARIEGGVWRRAEQIGAAEQAVLKLGSLVILTR